MRTLLGSGNEVAIGQIGERLAGESHHWPSGQLAEVSGIVRQAVLKGIPFPGLQQETGSHLHAVTAMAAHGQDWLITSASDYQDSALEVGLWRKFGKYARPEIKAFLKGLILGVPLFGQQPCNDSPYATVSLAKLRFFQSGLADLREQAAYRLEQRNVPTEDDVMALNFTTEFCGWIDQLIVAEKDLLFLFG